jgi:hypothetical protein
MDSLFACSGPGAGAAIAESIRIGYDQAMLVGGLFMNSLAIAALTRQWIFPAIVLGLLAVHPAWTVSAISGDCGEFKRFASWAFTWTGVVVLTIQAIRGFWMRRKVAQ